MQKKTMWITAAAIGAVLVLGGAGVAVAASDGFDDDDRANATSSSSNNDTRTSDDDNSDDDNSVDDNSDSGRGGSDSDRDDNGGDRDSAVGDNSDDTTVPATATERAEAESAAIAEIGGGTVREFDTGDSDDDYAYKVELVMEDGSEVEVEFAADLSILRIDRN